MFDCDIEIDRFHDDRVTLKRELQDLLRDNRDANQKRLKDGLRENEKSLPTHFVKQGSYAMRTMVYQKNNDYDIDDGAVFDHNDLRKQSSLDARKMVCTALQDDRFKKKPEVLKNCVRVYYDAGHHVDIPVYRTKEYGNGYELASSEWRESNPEGVNSWFDECRKKQSDGGKQLVRTIRLLKAFAKSRDSWKLPSGFALTVLSDEGYIWNERFDAALYNLFVAIKDRLVWNKNIQHPVIDESLSSGKESRTTLLEEKLKWAIDRLSVLHQDDCTRLDALLAWKEVFNTDFFDDWIEDEKKKRSAIKSFNILSSSPDRPVERDGGGRYGSRARSS